MHASCDANAHILCPSHLGKLCAQWVAKPLRRWASMSAGWQLPRGASHTWHCSLSCAALRLVVSRQPWLPRAQRQRRRQRQRLGPASCMTAFVAAPAGCLCSSKMWMWGGLHSPLSAPLGARKPLLAQEQEAGQQVPSANTPFLGGKSEL